jgi:hypothetical protein
MATSGSGSKPNPKSPAVVRWKTEPDAHDYPAAANYLNLLTPPAEAEQLAERLKAAPIVLFKAKDILRASKLELLSLENPHVLLDLRKVAMGVKLSPVLLVRGNLAAGLPTQIADGYHRVCASFHLSENTDIPARVIDLE